MYYYTLLFEIGNPLFSVPHCNMSKLTSSYRLKYCNITDNKFFIFINPFKS